MNERAQEQSSQPRTSNPPVVLHAKLSDVNGTPVWGLGFNPDPPPRTHVEVDLPKGSGGHDVIIHLAGNAPGVRFNTDDPIWVDESEQCPPGKGSTSEQITDIDCKNRTLTFHDKNSRGCTLTYQLNFIGAEPLDPMIRNGGF